MHKYRLERRIVIFSGIFGENASSYTPVGADIT